MFERSQKKKWRFQTQTISVSNPLLFHPNFKTNYELKLPLFADRLGVSNPTSRDKFLAAVHELKLFGGPVPDERQFRLNVQGANNKVVTPRTKKRSLPARPPNMQLHEGKILDLFISLIVRQREETK